MSDPVTNIEIDDVLASIRRLVAGDQRSAAPSPVRVVPGKLLLTSAFRIDPTSVAGGEASGSAPQTSRGFGFQPRTGQMPPEGGTTSAASENWAVEWTTTPPAMPLAGQPTGAPWFISTRSPIAPASGTEARPTVPDDQAAMQASVQSARPDPSSQGKTATAAPVGKGMPLDEAALRALVCQILREELKGALGERITRNLRQLVRDEIILVLTTLESEEPA